MTSKKYAKVPDDSKKNALVVVYPLDDTPEKKVDTSQLGPMPLTLSVRISLTILRGYLILMTILLVYRVLGLAGLSTKSLGH